MVDASLIKKLGIKPKQRFIILHAPEEYTEQIVPLLPLAFVSEAEFKGPNRYQPRYTLEDLS